MSYADVCKLHITGLQIMSVENEMSDDAHTVRIRGPRWEKIEKQAWKLSQQANKFVKPTDIVDAMVFLYTNKITLEDIQNAKKTR